MQVSVDDGKRAILLPSSRRSSGEIDVNARECQRPHLPVPQGRTNSASLPRCPVPAAAQAAMLVEEQIARSYPLILNRKRRQSLLLRRARASCFAQIDGADDIDVVQNERIERAAA
jgi:hypothetical protein